MFVQWKEQLGNLILNRLNLDFEDLVELPLWDWFEEGMTPDEALQELCFAQENSSVMFYS